MNAFFTKRGNHFIYIVIILILLSSCSRGETQQLYQGNPTPKDFLKNADTDIFVLGDIVYSNVQNVEWVQELDYVIGKQIGEITKQTDDPGGFKNGTSNKLPIGTKIFETDTPVYIAIVEGKQIPYIKMIEG